MIVRYVDRVFSWMRLNYMVWRVAKLVSLPLASLTVTRAARRHACTSDLNVTVTAVSVDRVQVDVVCESVEHDGLQASRCD